MEGRELVLGARRPVLLCHAEPDGDAVGSLLGLGHALRQAGQQPLLVSPDSIPASMSFLPGVNDVAIGTSQPLTDCDLAIVLDCGTFDRLESVGDTNASFFAQTCIVNIDHHVSNTRFGTLNLVNPEAAAVAEILYYALDEWGVPLGPDAATCLLAGILADTQLFRTPNTTAGTLRACAGLMDAGASLPQLMEALGRSAEPNTLRLWGMALSSLRADGGLVWASLPYESLASSGASPAEAEGLVDLLCTVRGASAVALLREELDGTVRVSLRSLEEGLNVARVAEHFLGGGHPRAAGCRLAVGLAAAEEQVLARLRSALGAAGQGKQ